MKRFQVLFWLCVFPAVSFCAEPGLIVSSITVTDNRVHESIVRNKLAFKAGDMLDDEKLALSRGNLYAMGLFKTLEIQQNPDGQGSVAVTVKAKDGWFALPWIMAGSRGGERYTGVMLMEQNLFRGAERLAYFGMFQNSDSLNGFSLMFPDFALNASIGQRDYTDYRYQNGEYTSGILVGRELSKLQDFGAISDSYNLDSQSTRLSVNLPVERGLRVSAGVNLSRADYSPITGSAPGDSGAFNALQAGINYGRNDSARDLSGAFGRIFGMGMADLEENFKPLSCSKAEWGFSASIESALKELESEHDYVKTVVSATRETKFCDYSRLLFCARVGLGSTLPFSQLFATNRAAGMMGVYAREFRGDDIGVASADYRYPLVRNRRGVLNADIFTEAAVVTAGAANYGKQGAGCNLSWQFWRFPLPLGIGYTYCIDDQNWQASFSIGGMF